MRTLFLLRHAKSDWADPGASDFERPLNPRGREAARAMGRELRRRGLAADCILASPAARVVETLAELADGYGGRMEVDYDPRLYLAPAETLLDLIRGAGEAHRRLLVVGHNPGMEQLALLLSRAGALRDQVAAKYPTGALAQISLPAAHWRDVGQGDGALELFLRPRDLASGLGPDD